MQITDARKQRTELRLQLFANGFTPLPNKFKACYLPEWSSIEATAELINSWKISPPRSEGPAVGSWKDTGIRCGDVVAFDFDIDDADILNGLLDVLIDEHILPETPLVRIGRPPREMWIYRAEGPRTAKRTTGGFGWADELAGVKARLAKDEPAGDFRKLQVEVLGTGSQFGAFGKHSDAHDYAWPVSSPLDLDIAALPPVTRETIDRVVARAEEYFRAQGLEQIDLGGGTIDGHYSRVYDLTPDMVFPTRELGDATVEDLEHYFQAHPTEVLRCTVGALRPSTGGSLAGMANLVQGMLCVSDHGSYTSHFRADNDLSAKLARISVKLRETFGITEDSPKTPLEAREAEPEVSLELDPRGKFDDNLEIALRRFAYVISDNTIFDTWTNAPAMDLNHFRNLMMPFFTVEETKHGEKLIRLVDAWLQNPDRSNVGSAQMRPDQAWPIYHQDGVAHANTYRPHVIADNGGGDAAIGWEFFRNLIPADDERGYHMQWLSYKLQNPSVRGPAMVMVANDRFGTGRGSYGALLTDMFSDRYVSNVDFTTLTGKSYQSQYNEWLVGSLIVVVNEAADNDRGGASKWDAKNQAYEHLKNIVDPANTRLQIMRKGSANYQATVFASILIMTNHADALVIPQQDRRFYIVDNGANQSIDYWTAFHEWRSSPQNIAAFVRELKALDLTSYNPYQAPPMTRAKAEMIHAGTSELDRAMAHVITNMPGRLAVRVQVEHALERYAADNAVDFPDEWRRAVEKMFLRHTKSAIGAVAKLRLEDGKQHTPRMLPGCELNVLQSSEAMLEEINKNGSTSRTLASAANVVSFSRSKLGQAE